MKYKNHRHIPIASACWANEMQNIADKPVIRSNQDIKTAKTCLPRSHISLKNTVLVEIQMYKYFFFCNV